MEQKNEQKQEPQVDKNERPVNNPDTGITKNPNPRANDNITEEDKKSADTAGTGSEITDGEAG
jgi:hypothetical protein